MDHDPVVPAGFYQQPCRVLVLVAGLSGLLAAADPSPLGLVPWPTEVRQDSGVFVLSRNTVIVAPDGLDNEAVLLAEPLRKASGFPIPILAPTPASPQADVIILRRPPASETAAPEGYHLSVTSARIVIEADLTAGLYYGTRTLLQLFPAQAAAGKRPADGNSLAWTAPCVEIKDEPRFPWRSFMLDEARSFLGLPTVKDYIDQMANLKMNVFQWHITDNPAWRLEIRQCPRLTTVGATSRGTTIGGLLPPRDATASKRYYYTQEEARELIAYAAKRHVRVIPEIEMPGHSTAAIRAYPEWGEGQNFEVTKPAVVEALTNILDEVATIFPDPVIHTGGDEVNYKKWATAPTVQAAMTARGLTSAQPLQAEFTATIARHLAGKGRRMMVWFDAAEQITGDQGTILQFWRGNPLLISQALQRGQDVVNCDNARTYLDYSYAALPLEHAYKFEPVPAGIEPEAQRRLLGVGCQAWGEMTPTRQRNDYQIFPRIAATAEVAWTRKDRRDFKDFSSRLPSQEQRWHLAGIQFYRGGSTPMKEIWNDTISGSRIGTWTSDQVALFNSPYVAKAENDHLYEATALISGPGRYRVAFVPTAGADILNVRVVELRENGKPVAVDWGGFNGAQFQCGDKNARGVQVFDLPLETALAGAAYTLRVNFFGLKGRDSAGEIFIKRSEAIAPAYMESP